LLYYRIDLFERINAHDNIDFTFIHGRDFKDSKFVNYKGDINFKRKKLRTLQYGIEESAKYLVYWPSLFFHLVKIRPDVIVFEGESNILNNTAVYLYSLLFNKKIIWWSLGLIPGFKVTKWQKFYKPFMLMLLKRAKYVIGYSEYTKNYYSQYISRDKILVANNCLDNEKIDKEILKYREDSVQLKRELNFDDKFVIIYVGALIKRKKVDRLIKSYQAIKKDHPECAMVLIGGGAIEDEIKDYVASNNIRDIHFAGKIFEGISKYFLMADLFVLPGLGGLSIFEAMVHSLPVISASADGTEVDLIQEGQNGYILKTDSVDELTELLYKFLNDKEMASSFGKASREIVENKINIEKTVGTFIYGIENSLNK
ncbi:MAG: glycosyltransferase family 4 protein, partial [Bacteroidota bacterium]